jgi:sugar phosphate isomerase/epimerase
MRRRQFLATLAAPAVCGARPRRGFDLSRIAVITDEVAGSPAAAIDFCKQYGVTNVELRNVPGARAHYGSLDPGPLKEAAKQFKDNGLTVSFLNTPFFKITLPGTEPTRGKNETPDSRKQRIDRHQAEFERRHQDFQTAFRNAQILGVDKMRVFTFLRVEQPQTVFGRVSEVIGEMAEAARKEGITLLVENEGACNVVSCAEMAAFDKLMPQNNVGMNWDPWNGFNKGEQPYPHGYGLLPKKRIGNVQFKGHSLLAENRLDWSAILDALAKDGYKGKAGLETHYFDGTKIEKSHLSMKEIIRILES